MNLTRLCEDSGKMYSEKNAGSSDFSFNQFTKVTFK